MEFCPLCGSANLDLIDIEYPRFQHLDFTNIVSSNQIGRCLTCQLIFNVVDSDNIDLIGRQFESLIYSQSSQTAQTVPVKEFDLPVERSRLQAELLANQVTEKQPTILDIGCFDGKLLSELNRKFRGADLHGLDINSQIAETFPDDANFHFWSTRLSEIPGPFDLICMSHSMMYFRDISYLANQIERLLKKDGQLFVQVPDISKNPYSILLGDSYYYYTPYVLGRIFQYLGFQLSLVKNDWFPREIVGIAKRAPRNAPQLNRETLEIYECMDRIDEAVRSLSVVSKSKRTTVLGTTLNAAFVDSLLNDHIRFFTDENPYRLGSTFRSKYVQHPKSLVGSDLLIIPYGPSSNLIKSRFVKQYDCEILCI